MINSERYQMHHVQTYITIIIIIAYFLIPYSNSFIIEERYCLYFLLQTLLVLKLFSSSNIIKYILLMCLVYLTRLFFLCREENQPQCQDQFGLLVKLNDNDQSIIYLAIVCSGIFSIGLLTRRNYYNFRSSGIIYIISILSIFLYWIKFPYSTLLVFYISILLQICCLGISRTHSLFILYPLLIFVTGYKLSLSITLQASIYFVLSQILDRKQIISLQNILLLSLMGEYFFYSTAHQPVLSQIRWQAAFHGQSSSDIIDSFFIRGIFVLLETFSNQILNVIFLKYLDNNKHQLLTNVLCLDCWKILMTSTSVFILRRHLMLWKIFCPRFLFQCVAFIVKYIVVILIPRTLDNKKLLE
ncbi:unnamed protein product [Didymodactylos carnosus]|uniref:Transmembrane protein n=1 Tax=Didymodactylos carnosus TaxID=1234261 RepID=A0A814JMF2_9BILA|nr:unnamed protein product [Didymodactylos carnosus]CAF3810011.1 unnamed protein product [Didymodactylos carnosus]